MQPPPNKFTSLPSSSARFQIAAFVIGTVLFAMAYGQAPLYYSNQNQYFLHGLAQAAVGYLDRDWLANTVDPTPLFSGLVSLTVRLVHPAAFHVYYALLQGLYAAALVGLFVALAGPTAAGRWPLFFTLIVILHSALLRWLSFRLLDLDYPWYFQSGVAGQYILGAMFQPSTFGVFLVVAIALFANNRPYWAALAIAFAVTLHSTYLLAGALITLGFLASLLMRSHFRKAFGVASLTLLLVLPTIAYVLVNFAPTSPERFATAQEILVQLRIPHHARVDLWLDPIAGLQIAWMLFGVLLTWRTTLFPVLAIPLALAAGLTVLQVATASNTLALLFPWRISAVLMPIATAIVLTRMLNLARLSGEGRRTSVLCLLTVAGFALGGVWIMVERRGYRSSDEELLLMNHVRASHQPHDVYLLPVRIPDLAKTTRGSSSSDFKPISQKQTDPKLIPVDLQRFRLLAETPIFIDFKSIPYKDTEVIEWHERLLLAQQIHVAIQKGRIEEAVAESRRLGITHWVESSTLRIESELVEDVYADAVYRVYHLRKN